MYVPRLSRAPSRGQRQQCAVLTRWLAGVGDVAAALRRLDLNGDGFLSAAEVRMLAAERILSMDACDAMVGLADADGDGQISLAEFLKLGTVLSALTLIASTIEIPESLMRDRKIK